MSKNLSAAVMHTVEQTVAEDYLQSAVQRTHTASSTVDTSPGHPSQDMHIYIHTNTQIHVHRHTHNNSKNTFVCKDTDRWPNFIFLNTINKPNNNRCKSNKHWKTAHLYCVSNSEKKNDHSLTGLAVCSCKHFH